MWKGDMEGNGFAAMGLVLEDGSLIRCVYGGGGAADSYLGM
jgi:hypothetical protein